MSQTCGYWERPLPEAPLPETTSRCGVGARIGTTEYRGMRQPGIDRVLHRAGAGLDKRGAALILAGRYLPGGRAAVNFTAGATAYPLTRFIWLDAGSCLAWAAYCIGVGVIAGAWPHHHPLPAAAVAIALCLTIGAATDHLLQRLGRKRRNRTTGPRNRNRRPGRDARLKRKGALSPRGASQRPAPRPGGGSGNPL